MIKNRFWLGIVTLLFLCGIYLPTNAESFDEIPKVLFQNEMFLEEPNLDLSTFKLAIRLFLGEIIEMQ